MHFDHYRIPDNVFLTLAVIITLLTWMLLILAYPDLPQSIPTHYGPSGAADAYSQKGFWSVFFAPIVSTILTIGFLFLHRHPKWMNIPSTLLVELLDEPDRSRLYRVFRHMLSVILVLMDALFAYIAIAILNGIQETANLNPWILFGFVGLILVVAIVYSVFAYRMVRSMIKKQRERQSSQPNV